MILGTLTERQRQVAILLAEGKSNAEIGAAMGRAVGTVKVHVCAVLAAYDVPNRTNAALRIARELARFQRAA